MKIILSLFVITNLSFGSVRLQAQETKTLNSSLFKIEYSSDLKFEKSSSNWGKDFKFKFYPKKGKYKGYTLSIRSMTYQKDNIKHFPINFGEKSDRDSIKHQKENARLDSLKTNAESDGSQLKNIEIEEEIYYWKALSKIEETDSNGDFIQAELFIILDGKEEKQFVKVYKIGNTRYWLEFRGPKEVYEENIEMVKTMFSTFVLKK